MSDNQNEAAETPIKVAQDVNLFVSELSPGRALPLELGGERQAYFLCVEGSVDFAPVSADDGAEALARLDRHDAAELQNEGEDSAMVKLVAGSQGAHVLYYEMAYSRSGGRGDL